MREKYIESRFPRYFIFGESPDGDSVDVSNGNKDVLEGITRSNAKSIIKEREEVVDFIFKLANAFDEADTAKFIKFWYEDSYE